ncbi:MAG: hypothetical protein IGBAC_0924 [Ignavibacteriae bacterium]|nr:MAG: hypothetical protein IGBAC_0924 [Ignavibacteriota bacterium]
MKSNNIHKLLVAILVSFSILIAQTDTKKSETTREKQKSCCASEKGVKSEAKTEVKKSDCTSRDASQMHDGKSDCTQKAAKDAKKECSKGEDCCQKTDVKKSDDSQSKDGKYRCPGQTKMKESKKI